MAGLPEQETFKSLTSGAYKLGKSLSRRKASRVFDTGRYKNILEGAKSGAPTEAPAQPSEPLPPSTPSGAPMEQFKNLGAITTQYGESTRFEKFHPGVDIANKQGTQVPTFAGGKVTELVTGKGKGKGFGNYVIVTDSSGAKHRYSHLYQTFVKMGQELKAGEFLGSIGATGSTYSKYGGSGAHLDYRIRDAYDKYINPSEYLSN